MHKTIKAACIIWDFNFFFTRILLESFQQEAIVYSKINSIFLIATEYMRSRRNCFFFFLNTRKGWCSEGNILRICGPYNNPQTVNQFQNLYSFGLTAKWFAVEVWVIFFLCLYVIIHNENDCSNICGYRRNSETNEV